MPQNSLKLLALVFGKLLALVFGRFVSLEIFATLAFCFTFLLSRFLSLFLWFMDGSPLKSTDNFLASLQTPSSPSSNSSHHRLSVKRRRLLTIEVSPSTSSSSSPLHSPTKFASSRESSFIMAPKSQTSNPKKAG
ncbi:hypothetical protein M5689_005753 [Euphorbia peplus]|nr:hypothetical protein M5689_005753 [Euphorbia peplus]